MRAFEKKYIYLIKEFSIAGFKARDQRAVLGFLWSFLNPLIMTSVLYFLFKSRIWKEQPGGYFVYILTGVVFWNFFSNAVQFSLQSLTGNTSMVRNVIFPKEILVFSRIGVFIIQFAFEVFALFLIIAITGFGFSLFAIFLPAVILIEILLIAGLSLFLSCLSVYAKDVSHIWNAVSRIIFFAVPVFYRISSLSRGFARIVYLNPVSQVIIFAREILLYHRLPSMLNLALMFIFSLFVFWGGYRFFKYFEHSMVEKV